MQPAPAPCGRRSRGPGTQEPGLLSIWDPDFSCGTTGVAHGGLSVSTPMRSNKWRGCSRRDTPKIVGKPAHLHTQAHCACHLGAQKLVDCSSKDLFGLGLHLMIRWWRCEGWQRATYHKGAPRGRYQFTRCSVVQKPHTACGLHKKNPSSVLFELNLLPPNFQLPFSIMIQCTGGILSARYYPPS